MSLTWISDPTGTFGQTLRRDIRAHRREKGHDGHRFKYSACTELHVACLEPLSEGEPAVHIVCTHSDDPVWQHWAHHPDKGWMLVGWWNTKEKAKASAESHSWDCAEIPADGREPGIYVLASWGSKPPAFKVHCRSKNIAITVADVLRHVGLATSHEEIA